MKSKKKSAVPWQARQGDVFIEAIDASPEGEWKEIDREDGRVVLAHGEVTGHAHVIRDSLVCFLRADSVFERVLDVMNPTALLTHEEHAPCTIAKGKYAVMIQQEYSPAELRNVAD